VGRQPTLPHPVIVLTHHEHPPIEMKGGTTFYFVTDGIDAALKRAVEGADGKDVRLGGGVSTV
jgi:dihydrofolate reductase